MKGHRAGSLLFALTVLALSGCEDDPTTTLSFAVPTEVAVDPGDFLGDVSCSEHEGAMRSYVMTLSAFEDEEDHVPFTIGSTQPAPCSLITGFRDVIVVDQRHIADIDGYDVPADLLVPFGGRSSGSRQMRHVETGAIVRPRWTTRCGTAAVDGAVASVNRRVFVRPCQPLVDSAPTATQISLAPTEVLGDDACELAPVFSLIPENGALPPAVDLACDGEPVVYAAEPGESYVIYATAIIDGARHGTLCSAVAASGVTVRARCHPLSASGRTTVDLRDVQASDDTPLCPSGAFYDVLVEDAVLNGLPLSCDSTAHIGPLAEGVQFLDVVVYDPIGVELGRGSCAAEVAPGKTTPALCLSD